MKKEKKNILKFLSYIYIMLPEIYRFSVYYLSLLHFAFFVVYITFTDKAVKLQTNPENLSN